MPLLPQIRDQPPARNTEGLSTFSFPGNMIRSEVTGFIFVVIVGSVLHFTYEASGKLWWVGTFSAMNESVWEHLKLAFWPALAWSLIQRAQLPERKHNFWPAKALALALMPVLIAVGYYSYTAALGHHVLVIDLMLFCGAVAIGQSAAIGVRKIELKGTASNVIAKFVIALEALAFSVLGFFPPNLPIFVQGAS